MRSQLPISAVSETTPRCHTARRCIPATVRSPQASTIEYCHLGDLIVGDVARLDVAATLTSRAQFSPPSSRRNRDRGRGVRRSRRAFTVAGPSVPRSSTTHHDRHFFLRHDLFVLVSFTNATTLPTMCFGDQMPRASQLSGTTLTAAAIPFMSRCCAFNQIRSASSRHLLVEAANIVLHGSDASRHRRVVPSISYTASRHRQHRVLHRSAACGQSTATLSPTMRCARRRSARSTQVVEHR